MDISAINNTNIYETQMNSSAENDKQYQADLKKLESELKNPNISQNEKLAILMEFESKHMEMPSDNPKLTPAEIQELNKFIAQMKQDHQLPS